MEFYNSESSNKELPFIEKAPSTVDIDSPSFVIRLAKTEKGFLLITEEYKAMVWIGSKAYDKLAEALFQIVESEYLYTPAVYVKINPANRKNALIAVESDEEHKARWSQTSPTSFEASEVLTKKKAKDRISKFAKP